VICLALLLKIPYLEAIRILIAEYACLLAANSAA
tara:strand:+ start:472 stop:573 length:102 start_codon:yes stop_codon:yes gene_type:complete